ncbi:MAG: hypothetical protein ACR2P7_08840 [bacterium]
MIPFEEFLSPRYQRRFRRAQLNPYARLLCALYRSEAMQKLKHNLTGTKPRLRHIRLARLAEDLREVDFERDVVDRLRDIV